MRPRIAIFCAQRQRRANVKLVLRQEWEQGLQRNAIRQWHTVGWVCVCVLLLTHKQPPANCGGGSGGGSRSVDSECPAYAPSEQHPSSLFPPLAGGRRPPPLFSVRRRAHHRTADEPADAKRGITAAAHVLSEISCRRSPPSPLGGGGGGSSGSSSGGDDDELQT